MCQVEDAVLAGRRPVIPASTFGVYANLITSCWQQDAPQRPSIDEVVQQLELMTQMNMNARANEDASGQRRLHGDDDDDDDDNDDADESRSRLLEFNDAPE